MNFNGCVLTYDEHYIDHKTTALSVVRSTPKSYLVLCDSNDVPEPRQHQVVQLIIGHSNIGRDKLDLHNTLSICPAIGCKFVLQWCVWLDPKCKNSLREFESLR